MTTRTQEIFFVRSADLFGLFVMPVRIGHSVIRKFLAPIVSLVVFSAAIPAMAVPVYDTIHGVPFAADIGWGFECNQNACIAVALPFSSATPVTITDITAHIWGEGSITLAIMGSRSVVQIPPFITLYPTDVLFQSQPLNISFVSPVTLTSLNWSIAAGSYWLALFPADMQTAGGWSYDFVDGTIPNGISRNFGCPDGPGFPQDCWHTTGLTNTAMALINGDAGETPLPAAFFLFATSLGALGLLGRRGKIWRSLRDVKVAKTKRRSPRPRSA